MFTFNRCSLIKGIINCSVHLRYKRRIRLCLTAQLDTVGMFLFKRQAAEVIRAKVPAQ